MIPRFGTRVLRQNDKPCSALSSESGEEGQSGTSGNGYDVDALADHFGTLMKCDVPPSLDILLRPLPQDVRHALHFEHNIEGILRILRDDNAVQLQGFVLDYLTGLLGLEITLVELLQRQEALLYFLATYTSLVQDRAGRHGLRITKPLFDGQAGAGQGVAAMKRQWAATEAPETGSAPTGVANEKGPLWPSTDKPRHGSLVHHLALELIDAACTLAGRVHEDRLGGTPGPCAPRAALTTILFLMDDVRFAHTMLAASAAGPQDATTVSLRLERVKHWQRTWVDEHIGPGAGGTDGAVYTAMDKFCLVIALLLLGLVLWMCVEVGVVEVPPVDFGAGFQGESLN